ncbi:speckle-type POZ protein-like A [Odontomachus brunneus]|uniref:speckle-type POZ protein-like A n=1 Tax=Odontomachus brunneus TaxID=486640 RepID=UPI0013F2B156|nr:speckle-type POZ protein-like A [Odontomachus brunneus]XP_032670148.1 speckle-type POZ protein-like A [Odontomachus brunneus]
MRSDINSNHTLSYCRTERLSQTYTYTWDITNFWREYMMLPLESPRIESQLFHFRLHTDDNKEHLKFYIIFKEWYIGSCHIFIKNTTINFYKELKVIANEHNITYIKNELLCSIPIIYLLENANCLPNNTLTVRFECKWYDVLSETVMCTNLQFNEEMQISSNKNNDMIPDKESLVIFVIGDERLYANKNLICSKSSVFDKMFNSQMKESETNEVEITDIKYNILKLFLSYIQFTLLPNLVIDDIQTLSELFVVADKYDVQDLKLLCELQLIKLIDAKGYIEFFDMDLIWLRNTTYLEKYIGKLIQVQPESIRNPQLAELIETNSKYLIRIAKYTNTNMEVSCSFNTHKMLHY